MPADGMNNGKLRPRKLPEVSPEEEIVISGMSGRFPESDNMHQLQHNLMNKVDCITDDTRRWDLDHPDIIKRCGKINNIEKFDALFFGVHFKQAHIMDPACRMLLEHAYEAIVDAGINPRQLRGSRTGVFIGTSFSESERTWFYEKLQGGGFGIIGCARAMFANRISYWLDVTGPSYAVDTACSSSLFALEHAYRAIREGLCDAAIVGGGNLCLHPYVAMQFNRLGVLSPDGKSKSFDESANGYVRSESVSVAFLQKAKDAKRIYATVVHGKINCDGFKEEGVTFPSTVTQTKLMQEFYMECRLSPLLVDYVEAHGTGTRVGDPEELNAIDKVFCQGRKTPLKIGSGKSNFGHAEPASGLCSIAKVILAMEAGAIQPNLHYNSPRHGVPALADGRMSVVTEVTPWHGGYIGVNSFGFGGANAHILLKSNSKEKVNKGAPNDSLPRLVSLSGRTEEAVLSIIDDLNSRPVDVEYVALYHNIHSENINGHLYRGYTILPPEGTNETPIKDVEAYAEVKRPIWFVLSGMGSQWPGMGEALLRIPIFYEAIRKCDSALKPHGIDIFHILTNKEKSAFDNIVYSFVGITATQIGLLDVLKAVGIQPDNIIGHSAGETSAAYADGCFTAEQCILAAYFRGLASAETEIVFGGMAAVGLGYNELRKLVPPEIEIACHNSPESCTISGSAQALKDFIANLKAKGIFAKEVASSNIPYHSSYIAPVGPRILGYLKKLIPNPQPRSEKWVSTSVPMHKWDTPQAKLSSAEYHANNLLSPVLFDEGSALIPKEAIAIEIAPHGLLQAILRRSLPPSVVNISLTKRDHPDNTQVLLQGLGKLFMVGLHPEISNLYPPVSFPVSRGTPMISPLIKWEHSDDWFVTSYKTQQKVSSGERVVEISLSDTDNKSLAGHVVDGRNLFPGTGYLAMAWESVGLMRGELYTEVSVAFEDVRFLRATNIPKTGTLEFTVTIHKGTGRFEIVEGGAAVVTGHVHACTNASSEKVNPPIPDDGDEKEIMTSRDVYKELRLRGYHYVGVYRSVKSSTITASKGHLAWQDDWVAFMDGMLQMQILGVDTRGLFVPTRIKKLVIDTKMHQSQIKRDEQSVEFPVYMNKLYDTIVSGGIEIRGLKASAIPKRKAAGEPVLEDYKFIPFIDKSSFTIRELIVLSTHISLENHMGTKVKTVEFLDESNNISNDNIASLLISESLGNIPLIQPEIIVASTERDFGENSNVVVMDSKKLGSDVNALLTVGYRLLTKDGANKIDTLLSATKDGGFLLTREIAKEVNNYNSIAEEKRLDVVLEKISGHELFILFKKRAQQPVKYSAVIMVSNDSFTWIEDMRKVMSDTIKNNDSTRVLFVAEKDFENGLVGLVNCLRKEAGGEMVRGMLIQDPKAPEFSLTNPLYAKQVQKDLVLSVLRPNGVWGSYRHLPLPQLEKKEVRHASVNQLVRGDLSSLTWIEGPIQLGYNHKDLVNIFYASINFKDVMLASGKLAVESVATTRQTQECVIGFEYSGIDSAGKRVMGMIENRAMANLCIADRDLSWQVPDKWSLEDAATIPCVYGTCYYALYKCGKMKKDDKVLIHAGTGGIGQAAINLALHEGCEVFTTVGTPDKKQFILEKFPQIREDHIGNSRDTSFEQMITKLTDGKGVDIVLNSLAEEKLRASVNCLAWGGRFLEIGKFDLASDNPLGMEAFLREISFQGVMLDHLFTASKESKLEVKKLVGEGLSNGAIKPLIRTVFPHTEVEAAFRFMAAGKHMGKVILKVREENDAVNKLTLALPKYHCLDERSYVILGGLGGFGLELADWLVLRGAKNLIITSRTGLRNGYQKMRTKLWETYGTKVVIISGKDASNRESCQQILETATKLAPIDGIFNLAVVLKDATWENQTSEHFEESFRTKAWATKNLDILSRKLCPKLRHFVVFSSVACGRGNAGQSNYAMSNSVMERICERRASEGLPALAIEWGAIGDVGLVADMQEDNKELVIGGTLQQRITSCLQELDGFMQQKRTVVSSMVVAEKKLGATGSASVVDTVLNIMGLKDLKGVSPTTSFAELGMDSMMFVEVKQILEREFEIFLTAQDIRSLNFKRLQELSAKNEESHKKVVSKKTTTDEILVGMKLLVRVIGNKSISHETCIKLSTIDQKDRDEIYLIPGMEGLSSVFATLAPKIKAPAICLQLSMKENANSIIEMADELLPHLIKRSQNCRQLVIIGYSYGALVAIELMRKLEAKGIEGKLILIDGAPEQIKSIMSQLMPSKTDDEFQNFFLCEILSVISPKGGPQLHAELEKCNTWDKKLDALLSHIPRTDMELSTQDQKMLVTAIYKRLLTFQNYKYQGLSPIHSPITLLRPTTPSSNLEIEDYDLSKITSNKVEVHYVDGNHVTMLDHENTAAIINGEMLNDNDSFQANIMSGDAK